MSQQEQEPRFDLVRFVVGYLEHEGSIVAAPAYGVQEVLLPDALAARLRVEPYLPLAVEANESPEAVPLAVGHPLVETIAEQLVEVPGHAQVFINHVRLDKRGLIDLAVKTVSLPNARLSPVRGTSEQVALHHYMQLNLKASFLSDEKQEQIVSVVFDVQGGYAVHDTELLERLVSAETNSAFPHMEAARPRWDVAADPLSPAVVQALLSRAQTAAARVLKDRLAGMEVRAQRLFELDAARIDDYYDSLARDLQQRLARSELADPDRQRSIVSKIEALHTERLAKLSDLQARHQLRVELELINVLVTVLPKTVLPVDIGNRRVTIQRTVVWNPLMHRLEPLVCDVCGEPGDGLRLCTGGHLAHRRCMAPQCIECNREYCGLCRDQVLTCVVCGQTVCRDSARLCTECGRHTCGTHQKLCHAADGQPAVLPSTQPAAPPAPIVAPPPAPKAVSKPTPKAPAKKPPPVAKKPSPIAAPPARPTASAVKINVEVFEDTAQIVAHVMRSTSRVLATRAITLSPEGILVECRCEKTPCPADGWSHRPASADALQDQVWDLLIALRQEYFLPSKRMNYYYIRGQQVSERPAFVLPPVWRNEAMLAEARRGFDRQRLRR